jgi:hypothetical protein
VRFRCGHTPVDVILKKDREMKEERRKKKKEERRKKYHHTWFYQNIQGVEHEIASMCTQQ